MTCYLTGEIAGTGGAVKDKPEDFYVVELPLYLPSGEGEHTYLRIEKRGITTLEAIRRLSRAVGVAERDFGYAGMKDARGVTRQTISVPRVDPEILLSLELPGIVMVEARRHGNKLRLGHLAGNEFTIRIHQPADQASERATAILSVLAKRGVPNFFGLQRFGSQGNSHLIGRAWLQGDYRKAVDALIGTEDAVRDERWQAAIAAYRRGDLEESVRCFPGHCRIERDIIGRLLKHPDEWQKALKTVHPRLKMLYFSALQSFLFNRVLEKRLDSFDTVMRGDLAYKHDNGACFLVEDVSAEIARAEGFLISPTGPMFGAKMKRPSGRPLAIEDEVLNEEGLGHEVFATAKDWQFSGERRSLRVPLQNPSVEKDDGGLVLRFSLPRGAYATAVLREVMKSEEQITDEP